MVGCRVCMHTTYSPVESCAKVCKLINAAFITIVQQYIYFHVISCKVFSKSEKYKHVTGIPIPLVVMTSDLEKWLVNSNCYQLLPSRQLFFSAGFTIKIRKTAGNYKLVIKKTFKCLLLSSCDVVQLTLKCSY